jgi:hypothetical protein
MDTVKYLFFYRILNFDSGAQGENLDPEVYKKVMDVVYGSSRGVGQTLDSTWPPSGQKGLEGGVQADAYTTLNPPGKKLSISKSPPDSGGKLTQILNRLENGKHPVLHPRLGPMPTKNAGKQLPPIKKIEDFFHSELGHAHPDFQDAKLGIFDNLGSLEDLFSAKIGPNSRTSYTNNMYNNRSLSEQKPSDQRPYRSSCKVYSDSSKEIFVVDQEGFLGSIPKRVVEPVGEIDKRSVNQETYKGLSGRMVGVGRGLVEGKKRLSLYGDVNISNTINVTNNVINNGGK